MKFVLFILLLASSAIAQQTKQFTLLFDYPLQPDEQISNITFRAHASTNLSTPFSNWTVVVTEWIVESSNATQMTFSSSNKVTAVANPIQYFVASSSNEWGGPIFSEVLATAPTRQGRKVRLR